MEKFVITNPHGLDVRCARMLVQTTLRFNTFVEVTYGNAAASGKSLLDLLALGVSCGGVVNVSCYGCDPSQAYQAIAELFNQAFYSNAVPETQELAVTQ
jgi:phosphotransferase system HPr (HPr) family protein